MSSQLLEEASKVIPNTALLVNLVSKRVRQLTMGHRPLVEVGPRMSNADIALKEIIDGKLTFEFQPEPGAKVLGPFAGRRLCPPISLPIAVRSTTIRSPKR